MKLSENGKLPNDMAYMVLEELGPDLQHITRLKGRAVLLPETVAMIGIQLVNGLEALHDLGYVHADIKPQNVLLGLFYMNLLIMKIFT